MFLFIIKNLTEHIHAVVHKETSIYSNANLLKIFLEIYSKSMSDDFCKNFGLLLLQFILDPK